MKNKYATIEEEINSAINDWDYEQMKAFLREILPLIELFDVDEADDWLEIKVGGDKENVRTIRLVRTMYLIARIAHIHTPKLVSFRSKYPNLHLRMQEILKKQYEHTHEYT